MIEDVKRVACWLGGKTPDPDHRFANEIETDGTPANLAWVALSARLDEMLPPGKLDTADPWYAQIETWVRQWLRDSSTAFVRSDFALACDAASHAARLAREELGEGHPLHRAGLQNWGAVLTSLGQFARAEAVLKQGWELAREADGTPARDAPLFCEALGYLCVRQGNPNKAASWYTHAVELFDPQTQFNPWARNLVSLSTAWKLSGDFDQADQALARLQTTMGTSVTLLSAEVLRERGNLAAQRSRYTEAEQLLRGAWDVQQSLTADDADKVLTLHALARVLEYQNRVTDAAGVRRTLKGLLAVDHPLYVAIRNEEVHQLLDAEQYAAAIGLLSELLRHCRERTLEISSHHEDVLENVGRYYVKRGKWRPAARWFKFVAEKRGQELGEASPFYAQALAAWGHCLGELGHVSEALIELQKARQTLVTSLGEKHEAVAYALESIGAMQLRQGDYTSACHSLEQSFLMRRDLLGPLHPATLTAALRYAQGVSALGGHDTAIVIGKQVALGLENNYGPTHRRVAAARANLGAMLLAAGQLAEARPLFESALLVFVPQQTELADERCRTLANLAVLELREERFADALTTAQAAREAAQAQPTVDEELVAVLANNEAVCHEALGDANSAARLYAVASAMLQRILGEQHPHTLAATQNANELPERVAAPDRILGQTLLVFLAA